MSARSGWRNGLLSLAFAAAGAAQAAETVEPDMEFLEYLGLWEETDQEWMMMDHRISLEPDERIDPVPEGEASTEDDDEN
jgi:2-polyprenyl-6-methoxyphenol hydroxylase-like FAD-dependent oxidoreductase